MLALVLSAIPAVAFDQNASCPDCSHAVSWFRGGGGFIGTVADGADEVVFVAACGNVSTTGEARVDGSTASLVFNQRNGLACDQEGGSLEIAGLQDGGWYWIHDDTNSAVGNLVALDVLDNERVELTSAGAGVTMSMGKGAVFLKELSSGRVGILPTILPEPPAPELRRCGYNDRGTTGTSSTATADQANARFTRRTSDCALGDGGTITLATTTKRFTGATTMVADKATVVRPSGSGSVVITVDLWGNASGHFTTSPTGHALLGQSAVALTDLRGVARLIGVTYAAELGSGPTATDFESGTAAGGITMDTTTDNVVTFTIVADSAYCNASPPRNNHARVSVTATLSDDGADNVTPPITRNASGVAGDTSFTVVCGSVAASAVLKTTSGSQQENP